MHNLNPPCKGGGRFSPKGNAHRMPLTAAEQTLASLRRVMTAPEELGLSTGVVSMAELAVTPLSNAVEARLAKARASTGLPLN